MSDDVPTAEHLDRLLALQSIDDEVRRLEHQLDGLVEQQQLDELVAQDAVLADGDAELEERLERTQREQRQVEGEIDALGQRLDEERVRLYEGALTSGREIQAAEAEIASTTRRRAEHEDQLLEVMERVEDLEARSTELREVRAGLAERIAVATAARDVAAQELIARIAEVQVRRDPVAAALPPALRSRYEDAAHRSGGTGVGVLRANACTACRITFSMSEINGYLMGPSQRSHAAPQRRGHRRLLRTPRTRSRPRR
jgi:predicted  nucleic acid-binding Zn-ribbon protein